MSFPLHLSSQVCPCDAYNQSQQEDSLPDSQQNWELNLDNEALNTMYLLGRENCKICFVKISNAFIQFVAILANIY